MSIETTGTDSVRVELSADAKALIDLLPPDGGTTSNPSLRDSLGWDPDIDRYYRARDEVEDAGLIQRGRGRGGTVSLALACEDSPETDESVPEGGSEDEPTGRYREHDLYEPMRMAIEDRWPHEERLDLVGVAVTAYGGKRADGKWSRPDITAIGIAHLEFFPENMLEVTTFEIKKRGDLDVTAIYEALSHRRAAHKAVVVVHLPEDAPEWEHQRVLDVIPVAREHGIGLTTAPDPSDWDTWEQRVEPQRHAADPADVNDFIKKMIKELHGPLRDAIRPHGRVSAREMADGLRQLADQADRNQ